MTKRYENRDLSWLHFNRRVLEEALDPQNPLLERLRFLIIFHTNLDEFFMIRVSGIKQQIADGVDTRSIDGLTPRSQLAKVHEQAAPMVEQAQQCLEREILPALGQHGLQVVRYADLDEPDRQWADDYYEQKIAPILTPLAVGPTHPFPFISNLALNLGLTVRSPNDGEERVARVKVPLANLPRLVPIRTAKALELPARVLFVEQLIAVHLGSLFRGMEVSPAWTFRVTRDADFESQEDEADDLMATRQQELRRRRLGEVVRLEVQRGMPEELRDALLRGLAIPATDVVEMSGPLAVPRMGELLALDLPELKFRPHHPRRPPALEEGADLFAAIRQRDVLVRHPFEAFAPVVELVETAARDPRVVAIKQTLYRTSGDSAVIRALEDAVERGKQVAAVVELKARFDEENNIVWARRLEQVGAHVVWGVPGLKVHAKLLLVVRREGDELVRYAHVGTGNYSPATARIYTDLGLFTADPAITADIADLFNRITGFARPAAYANQLVAPTQMKRDLLELITFETAEARRGAPARIIAKCNAITESTVIDALYEASRAGVRIDLLVRGICCLVPGVPGLSETVRVRSVVGRFLEHDRVYWFQHGDLPRVYIGSADLMERNLDRRIEVLVPIRDPGHAAWLRDVLLERYLHDRARTREMQPDGSWVRLRGDPDDPDVHQQSMA